MTTDDDQQTTEADQPETDQPEADPNKPWVNPELIPRGLEYIARLRYAYDLAAASTTEAVRQGQHAMVNQNAVLMVNLASQLFQAETQIGEVRFPPPRRSARDLHGDRAGQTRRGDDVLRSLDAPGETEDDDDNE